MIRRRVVAGLLAGFLVAACGGDPGRIDVADLPDLAVDSELTARSAVYESDSDGRGIRVAVDVADAHRYRATVAFDGNDTYEELVIDDRRWLRPLSDEFSERLVREMADCLPEVDDGAELTATLRDRGWVEDAAGAPAEFLLDDPAPRAVGPETALRAVRFLEQVPEFLRRSSRVREWNPRAIDYVPSEDRFEAHEDLGTRFDALPPEQFDADRVFRDGIPSADDLVDHFRFVGIWVDADRLVRRVEVLVDVPDLSAPVARIRQVEAARRGIDPESLPPVALPGSSSVLFALEATAPSVPAAPNRAPMLDLVCMAASGGS